MRARRCARIARRAWDFCCCFFRFVAGETAEEAERERWGRQGSNEAERERKK
jgi:hypothetical protein